MEWYEALLFGIVAIGFTSIWYSQWQKRRTLRSVWSSFATNAGWSVLDKITFAVLTIAGIQDKRAIEITAYAHYAPGFRSYEHMDVILNLNNSAALIVHSGTKEKLIQEQINQSRRTLNRVKSGDRIFDSAYHIKGYPEDILGELLKSSQVQLAIKTLYPNSTPLYGQPNLQIAGKKLALRLPQVYYDEKQLSDFIKHCCTLADAIEDALTMVKVEKTQNGG